MTDINIKVDQQVLSDTTTVDEVIGLQEGDIKTAKMVLGRFVLNGNGEYLPPEEGQAAVGALTITQLVEASKQFAQLAEGAAVPLASDAG